MSCSSISCVCRVCSATFPLHANRSAGLCSTCAVIMSARACMECVDCRVIHWDCELYHNTLCSDCVNTRLKMYTSDNLCEFSLEERGAILYDFQECNAPLEFVKSKPGKGTYEDKFKASRTVYPRDQFKARSAYLESIGEFEDREDFEEGLVIAL